MRGVSARQLVRRLTVVPVRRALRRARSNPTVHRPELSELSEVNRRAGIEPLKPELSGLALRKPNLPQRAVRLAIQLSYRWQPSEEYRRRQREMQETNTWAREIGPAPLPPPVLAFPDENDVAPHRLQPLLDAEAPGSTLAESDLPWDITDLAEEALRQATPAIQPRLPALDPEDMPRNRPLLPRRYRQFLRRSPYPRVVVGVVLGLVTVLGGIWMTQLQQEEAVAQGRLHVARQAFLAALARAGAYGVDPRVLQPLAARARGLAALAPPSGLVLNRSRVRFFRRQASTYRSLARRLRQLERHALAYWTWRKKLTYAGLLAAVRAAAAVNLSAVVARPPACDTPRCLREEVTQLGKRVAWLRETTGTLRVYGHLVSAAPDPAAAAAAEIQKAHALAAILPQRSLPAALATLDGMHATAQTADQYARAGALAHLDADALHAALVGALPARAVVVSLEDQQLTLYVGRRAAGRSAVAAWTGTPTGIFSIQGKQASVPVTYWGRDARGYGYRYGGLPDWMPFSNEAALQAAPWRLAFGPGSNGMIGPYAPDTPGSIDLPPAFAAWLYGQVQVGTEVVVY